MINATMRNYDYFIIDGKDNYGQDKVSEEIKGQIKLAIYTLSTTIGTNVKYKDATYIALTHNKSITDSYVIKFGEQRLKVMYVIPFGRYSQVFLAEM